MQHRRLWEVGIFMSFKGSIAVRSVGYVMWLQWLFNTLQQEPLHKISMINRCQSISFLLSDIILSSFSTEYTIRDATERQWRIANTFFCVRSLLSGRGIAFHYTWSLLRSSPTTHLIVFFWHPLDSRFFDTFFSIYQCPPPHVTFNLYIVSEFYAFSASVFFRETIPSPFR